MNDQKKFFSELRKYLNRAPESKRFVSELENHLEDKKRDEYLEKKTSALQVEELGDPKKLARLYRRQTADTAWKNARISSFIISVLLIFILTLAFLDGDGIYPGAIPFISALSFGLIANVIAWRFRKIGGTLIIGAAVWLFIAVNISAFVFNLGALFGIFEGLLLSLPFVGVGILFLQSSREIVES